MPRAVTLKSPEKLVVAVAPLCCSVTEAPLTGAPVEPFTTTPTTFEVCATIGSTAARSANRNSLSLILIFDVNIFIVICCFLCLEIIRAICFTLGLRHGVAGLRGLVFSQLSRVRSQCVSIKSKCLISGGPHPARGRCRRLSKGGKVPHPEVWSGHWRSKITHFFLILKLLGHFSQKILLFSCFFHYLCRTAPAPDAQKRPGGPLAPRRRLPQSIPT